MLETVVMKSKFVDAAIRQPKMYCVGYLKHVRRVVAAVGEIVFGLT